MKKYSGMLITFEGGDGSGKSTHTELFKNYLDSKHIPFIATREPGGTDFSEAVRSLTKDPQFVDKSKLSELLLFEAARADIVEKRILPSLESGLIVIMDRFFDSTTAYQSFGRGLPRNIVDQANKIASCGLTPDLTFYMRVEPKTAFERKGGIDNDAFEIAGLEFQNKVIAGFDKIASENPDRIVVVDTSKDVQDVFDYIVKTFESRFGR